MNENNGNIQVMSTFYVTLNRHHHRFGSRITVGIMASTQKIAEQKAIYEMPGWEVEK
jgi:hypothetical protein